MVSDRKKLTFVGKHSASPPGREHFKYRGFFIYIYIFFYIIYIILFYFSRSLGHCLLSLLRALPGSEVEIWLKVGLLMDYCENLSWYEI